MGPSPSIRPTPPTMPTGSRRPAGRAATAPAAASASSRRVDDGIYRDHRADPGQRYLEDHPSPPQRSPDGGAAGVPARGPRHPGGGGGGAAQRRPRVRARQGEPAARAKGGRRRLAHSRRLSRGRVALTRIGRPQCLGPEATRAPRRRPGPPSPEPAGVGPGKSSTRDPRRSTANSASRVGGPAPSPPQRDSGADPCSKSWEDRRLHHRSWVVYVPQSAESPGARAPGAGEPKEQAPGANRTRSVAQLFSASPTANPVGPTKRGSK